MIPAALHPTALIDPADRAPVTVRPAPAPGRRRVADAVASWLAWFVREALLAIGRKPDPKARGRRLRELLERLGGAWIKLGQLLSLRIDFFDVEFCQELALLQDRAYGFSGETARRLVEEELGSPVDAVFSEFEVIPIAAASIGQVHRARLLDGTLVAVKIRRPYVEEAIARDLGLLRAVAAMLETLRVAPFMRWRSMHWELAQMLSEELDYRREASAMVRLRDAVDGRRMYVPRVFEELSTARVLVMEFVSGVLMSDYIVTLRAAPARVRGWERENNIDPRRIVRRFSQAILRQIIEENLYHGDLHPGNIVLLRDSRIALLDFGAVGFTDRDYLERFRRFMHALASQEYERAADLALLMTTSLPDADMGPARAAAVRELRAWGTRTGVAGLPYQVKSVDAVNVAITRVFIAHRITFQWAFLRIRRALSTMDATAMHLYPEADYTAIAKAYFVRAGRRALRCRAAREAGPRTLARAADGAELLRQIGELTELAAGIGRRRLRTAQKTISGATRAIAVSAGWVGGAAAVAALIALAAMARQHGPSWMGLAASTVSAGLADRAPVLDWQIWIALCALAVLTSRTAAAVRAALRTA